MPMTAGPPASSARTAKRHERRLDLEDWCGDADAFGDVVQREAEDQEGAEARRTRREGGTDGETFAEIVQADAEGDIGGQRQAGRRAWRRADRHAAG